MQHRLPSGKTPQCRPSPSSNFLYEVTSQPLCPSVLVVPQHAKEYSVQKLCVQYSVLKVCVRNEQLRIFTKCGLSSVCFPPYANHIIQDKGTVNLTAFPIFTLALNNLLYHSFKQGRELNLSAFFCIEGNNPNSTALLGFESFSTTYYTYSRQSDDHYHRGQSYSIDIK